MISKIVEWFAVKVFRMDPLVDLTVEPPMSKDAYVCSFKQEEA
jgi:hypothetical protein